MNALLEFSSHPLVIAFALIVISWLWEDASLVSSAILAADDKLPVSLAVSAVFVGICSGDLALYILGRFAHRWRKLRAWVLMNKKSRQMSRRFRQHTFVNILIIRFVPGLRAVGFTLCGFLRVSQRRFLAAMMLSGVLWIGLVFSLVYHLGKIAWFEHSAWKWSLMSIALLLLILNNVIIRKREL